MSITLKKVNPQFVAEVKKVANDLIKEKLSFKSLDVEKFGNLKVFIGEKPKEVFYTFSFTPENETKEITGYVGG